MTEKLTAEEIERLRKGHKCNTTHHSGKRLVGFVVDDDRPLIWHLDALNALCDMALATASRRAGEEEVEGLDLERLRERAEKASAVAPGEWAYHVDRYKVIAHPDRSSCEADQQVVALCATGDGAAMWGSYIAEAQPRTILRLLAALARQQGEIADLQRNRCEECGAKVSSYPNGCPTCGAPQCCQPCCKIEYLQSEFATERAARQAVEDQNKRFVESQAVLYEQWKAMKRAVEATLDDEERTLKAYITTHCQGEGTDRAVSRSAAEARVCQTAVIRRRLNEALTAAQGEGEAPAGREITADEMMDCYQFGKVDWPTAPTSEGHTAGERLDPLGPVVRKLRDMEAACFGVSGRTAAEINEWFNERAREALESIQPLLRPDPLLREAAEVIEQIINDAQWPGPPVGKTVERARSAHAKLTAILAQGGDQP